MRGTYVVTCPTTAAAVFISLELQQRCTVNRYRHRRRGKKLFTVTGKFENFTGKNPVNSDTEVLFRFVFFVRGFLLLLSHGTLLPALSARPDTIASSGGT